MLIATFKASLVALIFMHLRHDKALNSIIFVSSLIFLGILLGFCTIDLGSRERVYPTLAFAK
jgi:cytochrome c oxidase subunit 4